MKKYKILTTAFVTQYGEWGQEQELIIFNPAQLTDEEWETLSDLPDNVKLSYAIACMDGDKETAKILSE